MEVNSFSDSPQFSDRCGDTIADDQKALRTPRIYDEFTWPCNPDKQAMVSLIREKQNFAPNQDSFYFRFQGGKKEKYVFGIPLD